VRGSHAFTLRILARARALGLPLQVNTTVSRQTAGELPALAAQMERLGIALWALFFLIPVGRAQADQALGAEEIEGVLRWAAALERRASFPIKTTEAPHFQRVLARRAARLSAHGGTVGPALRMPRHAAPADAVGRAPRAVTDGNGFVFVDHVGNICPSGFLPLPAGNVRTDDLVSVYRDDALFRALRDADRLGGRCGVCEYRERCGGSRARAYAATGDPLAEDPGCAWQPGAASPVPAGGSDVPPAPAPPAAPARADIEAALETVLDPELGMSVMELGLVYDVAIVAGAVRVTMTLTAHGCPLHEVMGDWVRRAVLRVPGVERVDVVLTFDPPWTPDRMRR
jgi:metal-sulfur cluster biosynthetic enzyme